MNNELLTHYAEFYGRIAAVIEMIDEGFVNQDGAMSRIRELTAEFELQNEQRRQQVSQS